MKRMLAAVLTAVSLLFLMSCASQPASSSASAESSPAENAGSASSEAAPAAPILTDAERAVEIVSQMSLEEKVGQLFFARVPESDAANDVYTYHLGGYILFGRDTKDKTANELIQTIQHDQDMADIPLLIGVDEEGGTVVRVSSNPHIRSQKFKSPQQLYAQGDLQAIIRDTREKDVLLKALGFNVNLAPVADVSTDPKDFIFDRSFGQDAAQTSSYTSIVTSAMTSDGMGRVLKHFPGYGNNADTHTGIAVDNRSLETFETSDFLPFTSGLHRGGGMTAVLVSHNIVTCMDPELPASLSPTVHEKLRKLMADAGCENNVVMTDDLVMDAVKAYADNGSVAALAIQAGNDLLIATDYREQIPQVIAAVKDGTLDEKLIDAACGRVLQWKMALGLL